MRKDGARAKQRKQRLAGCFLAKTQVEHLNIGRDANGAARGRRVQGVRLTVGLHVASRLSCNQCTDLWCLIQRGYECLFVGQFAWEKKGQTEGSFAKEGGWEEGGGICIHAKSEASGVEGEG